MLLDTPLCDFGWKAAPFSLSDPEGTVTTLDKAMGENGLLVAFICNHCPYVVAIIERLVADAKNLQSHGIGVVAIMANDYKAYPADSPARMKQFASHYGFTFPYLVDEDQSVARAYGAVCTPDFFGFNKRGELQYRGRIDDVGMGRGDKRDASQRTPELLNAMLGVAKTGAGPREQLPSMGCSIKWK